MPVTFEVIENGLAIKYTVIQPWTMAELAAYQDQEIALRDQSDAPIHVIVDITHMGNLAPGTLGAHRLPALKHPRAGQYLVVGGNTFFRTMAELIFKLVRKDLLHFFDTEEAAIAFLQKQSETTNSENPI